MLLKTNLMLLVGVTFIMKKWIWSLFALYSPLVVIKAATVKNQNPGPGIVEAQAKFFQYRNQPNHEDFDQGHRLGSEKHFTERHEHSRPSDGLFSAKIRWGDKHGGYGEHYWDLNHAGHNDNDDSERYTSDSDDSSYKVHDDDPYDEPSEQNINYDKEYSPEKSYDDKNRAKRDYQRTPKNFHDIPRIKPKRKKVNPVTTTESVIEVTDEPEVQLKSKEVDFEEDDVEDNPEQDESKDNSGDQKPENQQNQYTPEPKYVPYESGAGVRQHYAPEATVAESAPRLFLEPSTGHVVDRATGQAYILQPILVNNNNYYN